MYNHITGSCPYQNWTAVARKRCPNPDNFHCLKDEYGRIGWVCREPIWVEKGRCPVFNVGAKKLDTTSCLQTRCPPYNYRSNDINVEYPCRYLMETESTTTFTSTATETNNIGVIAALTVLTLVIIVVFVVGIMFYKCRRRQRSKNNGKHQEEFNTDLIQDTATEKLNAVKEPNRFVKFFLTLFC